MRKRRKISEVDKQEYLKHKRSRLPALMITALLWSILISFVYFVDPGTTMAVQVFFILLFFSLLFMLSIIFTNKRRGLMGALFVVIIAFMRYVGIGNLLNLALLAGIFATVEIYISSKS